MIGSIGYGLALVGIAFTALAVGAFGVAGFRLRRGGVNTSRGAAMGVVSAALTPFLTLMSVLAVWDLGRYGELAPYLFVAGFMTGAANGALLAGAVVGVSAGAYRAYGAGPPHEWRDAMTVGLVCGIPLLGLLVMAGYGLARASSIDKISHDPYLRSRPHLEPGIGRAPTERRAPQLIAILAVALVVSGGVLFADTMIYQGPGGGSTEYKPTASLAFSQMLGDALVFDLTSVSGGTVTIDLLTLQVIDRMGWVWFNGPSGSTTRSEGTNTTVTYVSSSMTGFVTQGDTIEVRFDPLDDIDRMARAVLKVISGNDVLGTAPFP